MWFLLPMRPRTWKPRPHNSLLAVWYLLLNPLLNCHPEYPVASARSFYENPSYLSGFTLFDTVNIRCYCVVYFPAESASKIITPTTTTSVLIFWTTNTLILSSVLTYYLVRRPPSVRSNISRVYFIECLRPQQQWPVTTTPVSKCSLRNLKSRKWQFSTPSCCLFDLSTELILKRKKKDF